MRLVWIYVVSMKVFTVWEGNLIIVLVLYGTRLAKIGLDTVFGILNQHFAFSNI